jgi:ATP-dependent DNA helicase DinG
MRRAAERARVVVVNHHLFFADLALRGPHPGRVLPDYDAVIFDEAHQLEDIATTFFGFRVSRARVDALANDVEKALSRAGDAVRLGASRGTGLLAGVRRASEAMWESLRSEVGADERRVSVEQGVWAGPLCERWLDLDESLEALGALAASASGRIRESGDFDITPWADALDVAQRRSADLRQQLAQIVEGASDHVAWFDSNGRRAALAAAPIDLAPTLRARVFEAVPAAVLTSATLTSTTAHRSVESSAAEGLSSKVAAGTGDFTFLRRRLGLDELEATQLVVPSPFDFAANALFFTPSGLVLPNDAGFQAAAVDRIEQLIELTDGGAFVLTTSLRSMNGLCRELRRRTPRPVLLQGEAPKQALVHAFRSSGDAVLVATMSFWEGVDVPGRALRLVVIDKIPFPVPSDPIVRARSLAIEEAGRNPFTEYHVPAAAIALKQGFGRLIRTRTDIGVVALLDERVHRRGYGRWLLGALPPAARTQDYGVVRDFWLSRRD